MNYMKRAMIVCLVAAMAVSAFGCGKGKSQDIPVETISLEQTKQELTFDFKTGSVDETDAPGQDAVEETTGDADETKAADTTAAPKFEEVTEDVKVTDAAGQNVTDAAGEDVTEVTVVATRPLETEAATRQDGETQDTSEGETQATSEGETTAENIQATTTAPVVTDAPTTAASYTPAYDTCKAYWLDMSKMGDFTFDGEFLTVTFQVKQDIPDGSYPVTISKTDIASWEEVKYTPKLINGEVAVNQKTAGQEAMPEKDFTLKVNSVEAKQGQTVTMTIDLANNPGFCGFVIDIKYDSNAMSIVEAKGGKDYNSAVSIT